MMDWKRLMSHERLSGRPYIQDDARTPDLHDLDRIVFSSAFRRMQDKTQVFPLPSSDYVRTRLTHSIETSCVGRSMAAVIGKEVIDRHKLHEGVRPEDQLHPINFGITAGVACLAHDIGNPPFGHSGEDAIQYWFRTSDLAKNLLYQLDGRQQADFWNFDGNAQGFRILTRLQNAPADGGLRLTCSTLAAFTKYPRESSASGDDPPPNGISTKKHGFFQSEVAHFQKVAETVGLSKRTNSPRCWARHPLAFVVEAADDICYHIIDFEDGHRLKLVGYDEVSELLLKIVVDEQDRNRVRDIPDKQDKIAFLRGRAIAKLGRAAATAFLDHESEILDGTFDQPLVEVIGEKPVLDEILKKSRELVYSARSVLDIEAAGFEVIGGLLESFAWASTEVIKPGHKGSKKGEKYLQLLPDRYRNLGADTYQKLLNVVDYVSGMTDSFAVALYKNMRGISLPSS